MLVGERVEAAVHGLLGHVRSCAVEVDDERHIGRRFGGQVGEELAGHTGHGEIVRRGSRGVAHAREYRVSTAAIVVADVDAVSAPEDAGAAEPASSPLHAATYTSADSTTIVTTIVRPTRRNAEADASGPTMRQSLSSASDVAPDRRVATIKAE